MNQINVSSLDEGDELGLAEIPECCDALMDEHPGSFQCGRCGSRVDVDDELTVTCVRFGNAKGDGTPTNDPQAALHWAAVAIGLAEGRTGLGHPLTDTERAVHDRYQGAARDHGFTTEHVRDYLNNTLRPAIPTT